MAVQLLFRAESNAMQDGKNVHITQILCEQISVAKEDNLRAAPNISKKCIKKRKIMLRAVLNNAM